jgi:NADH dehydrogenase/NADH:ubiquinone oxidoreductase subunit G
VVFTPFLNDIFKQHADIIIPIKTPYESCGSFINISGLLQNFNHGLNETDTLQTNQDILFDALDEANAKALPFENIISKTQLFIAESKSNKNKNTELPTINPILDPKSTRNYSLYNVDSMVRRSKPLQLTRESKIQSEKK